MNAKLRTFQLWNCERVPDRTFRNARASKSVDGRTFAIGERGSTDFAALKLWSGRSLSLAIWAACGPTNKSISPNEKNYVFILPQNGPTDHLTTWLLHNMCQKNSELDKIHKTSGLENGKWSVGCYLYSTKKQAEMFSFAQCFLLLLLSLLLLLFFNKT